MKLTEEDKTILLSHGYRECDFRQIEIASANTKYELQNAKEPTKHIRIGSHKTIKILGRELYWSGISRSAFHYSAARSTPDNKYTVYFDSSAIFADNFTL